MLIFDSSISANFVVIVLLRNLRVLVAENLYYMSLINRFAHIYNARKIILFMRIGVYVDVYAYILYTINSRFANIGTWTLFVYSTSREREKMSEKKRERETDR